MYAKNQTVLMVRRQRRRGDEILCLHLQEKIEDRRHSAAGKEWTGLRRDVPAVGAGIPRAQRRSAIQIQRIDLILCEL